MKVYIVNDCFRWSESVVHYGCRAIMDSLKHRVIQAGHEIVAVTPRPLGPELEHIEKCDWVIINGEGSFRDEVENFEPGRHDRMYHGIKLAKSMGKRVYLTNAVWCRMSNRWAPVLESLDGISVREPKSAEAIHSLCGRRPEVHIDESYFKEIVEPTIPPSQADRIVVGNFYENAAGVRDWSPEWKWFLRCGLMQYEWDWIVTKLKHSALYFTGQHHGVYAACKARCPFAACRVNTHKLTSLFEWAGVQIPLASDMKELMACQRYADANPNIFIKLFHFMEEQSPWPIPVS